MTKAQSENKICDKIFDKWRSDLRDRPKRKDNLYDNFYDLFFEMSRNFISPEIAYDYVKKAATLHLPDSYILDKTYKVSISNKSQTKTEFFESWKSLIFDKATQAFYDIFPLERAAEDQQDKIQLPRGMSKKEYVLQRQHAREFPLLDIESIMDSYKNLKEDEDTISFDDLLGDLNGKDRPGQDK